MNYGFTNQLDTLLEKDDITIEQILEEENIVQDIKNQCQQKFAKLLQNNTEIYSKMIGYVIDYSPEFTDQQQQKKYPFLCSEILSFENAALIDFLFETPEKKEEEGKEEEEGKQEQNSQQDDNEAKEVTKNEVLEMNFEKGITPHQHLKEVQRRALLSQLMDFLKQDSICITSAGYFSKTMSPIIRRRGLSLWEHIRTHPEIIGHLMKHIDTTHIADIVEKLILIENIDLQEETYLNLRHALLKRCLNLISNKQHQPEIMDNIAFILNEIIIKAMQNPENKELQSFVEEINQPQKMFEIGTLTQSPQYLQIIINMIHYYQKLNQLQQEGHKNKTDDDLTTYEEGDEQASFQKYYDICDMIVPVLKSEGLKGREFITTYGEFVNPIAPFKISVIQIVIALLQTNDPIIIDLLADNKTFQNIQNLVVKHQFNNNLIILYEKLTLLVFDHDKYQAIQSNILSQGLLRFLSEKNSNQYAHYGTLQNKIKPGYQGILSNISNFLIKKSKQNSVLEEMMNSSPEWQDYVKTTLNNINQVQEAFLCGVNPKARQMQEESGSEQDVERILDKFRYINQGKQDNSKTEEVQEIQQDENPEDNEEQLEEDYTEHEEKEVNEKLEVFYEHHEVPLEDEVEEELIQENEAKVPELEVVMAELTEQMKQVMLSPREEAVAQFGEMIKYEETMEQFTLNQQEIENKSDSEVNMFWKVQESLVNQEEVVEHQ